MSPRTTCTDPEVGRLLAAYDAGILDPPERQAFEQHIASCEACREGLFELAPHVMQLRQHPGRAVAYLAGVDPLTKGARASASASAAAGARDFAGAGPAARKPKPWLDALRSLGARAARPAAGPWRWAALIPAAAVAAVVILLLGDRGSLRERDLAAGPSGAGPWAALAKREALPFTRTETRAPGDPTVADFDAGMERYLAGDYATAATELAGVVRRIDDDRLDPTRKSYPPARLLQRADQAALYAGIAFLMAERGDSARVHLQRATEGRLGAVADHARWYLAQANLLEGDPEAAAGQLRLLANSPAYSQRAGEQLQALGAEMR